MNAQYKDGKISFDLHGLLEGIQPVEKIPMVESLACDDDIIKHVAAQIISKWTENCYSGCAFVTASDSPQFGLDWAWREVAKKSGDVAKREIERLEDALRREKNKTTELYEEIRHLQQARH